MLEKISQLQQTALEGWVDRYRIDLIKSSQNPAVIAEQKRELIAESVPSLIYQALKKAFFYAPLKSRGTVRIVDRTCSLTVRYPN